MISRLLRDRDGRRVQQVTKCIERRSGARCIDYRRFADAFERPAGRVARAVDEAFFTGFTRRFAAAFVVLVRTGADRFVATCAFLGDGFLLGAALGAAACRTGLAGAAAGAGFGAAAADDAALTVIGFVRGRPPLRANCASANILLNASFASAINWACDIRRSCIARAFSAR
jgi:hypothetical protein